MTDLINNTKNEQDIKTTKEFSEEDIENLFKDGHIDGSKLKNIISVCAQHQKISISSAPFPEPEVLAKYKEIYPGSEKIIFDMAQKQTEHRINMETFVTKSREKQSSRGQIFAFIITILLMILAVYCLILGCYKTAATIITGTMVVMASLFIAGKVLLQLKKSKPKEMNEPSIDEENQKNKNT